VEAVEAVPNGRDNARAGLSFLLGSSMCSLDAAKLLQYRNHRVKSVY
jgi:hypothetical protein